jgi:Mrp family chromosome partitioning ATPase
MTLEQYWTVLIKRWKLVVICFLLVGVGTFIGSKLVKPLYQSSVLVQVVIQSGNNNQADYNNLLASEQLVQTEATLAVSDPVLRAVASHYPGLEVSQLVKEVSSSPRSNTQLFEIDVVDPSPTLAARLANDIASTLIKQQLQVMQQDNARALQQIQQNIDLTSQQINDTTAKISALQAQRGNQGRVALLQAQLSGLQQHFNQWQTALAQLELTQAQSGNPLQVVQPAQPPTSPTQPGILLTTGVGLLVGVLLGVLLALLYERLDTRMRTPEEISQLLEWPVLATIWRAISSKQEDMINPTGNNVNRESFRILRTSIGFSSVDKPLRSLIVTSALPGEGKSAIAANLAIFMSKAGKNTLLIDADLRRPTQHALFNLSPDKLGLSNAILAFSLLGVPNTPYSHQFVGRASAAQTPGVPDPASQSLEPYVHSVGIPNLWVMPSGPLPPNPSEFLESKVMQRFLSVVANCGIEVVIFDTAPLLGLSDTCILASKVDGAIVVVDTTRATKVKLRQMKVVLSQTGVRVLGCVANKLKHKRNDGASYYYYQPTEERESREKSTRNGHMPAIPITSVLVEPSSEQRFRSN